MKRLTSLVCLSLVLFASLAIAAEASRDLSGYVPADARGTNVHYGAPVSAAKAAADTVYVMGGPARQDGKFQDNTGTLPDAEGWFGVDLTQKTIVRWSISTYNPPSTGNNVWCGELFTPCFGGDPEYGYGNSWDEYLDWYGTVADNTVPTSVTLEAKLNHDVEPDYDYVYLEVERSTGMDRLVTWTSANVDTNFNFVPVQVNQNFSVAVADYVGPSTNQVHLRWHVFSDGGYSDGDCNYPSSGACMIDDIVIKFGATTVSTSDFEAGLGEWAVAFPPTVGDFSKVWPRLADIDPCNGNPTPVFAFIDDGVVVPGTGGFLGTTWTYGPSGYAVNLIGGLAGPDFHMNNEIWSPVLDWPAGGYDGGRFTFDVYRHLPLSNGGFYVWHIQSSDDGGATWQGWQDDNFVYYSNAADWLRVANNITAKMLPGRNKVQLALGFNEYGWNWGYNGTDGTPAPYFDNVQLLVYTFGGPGMETREIDVFNDNFPAIGTIDYLNLGANSVRVDMARNIANQLHLRNDPGDSMYVDVTAVRTGSVLNALPEMYVRMKANPLFDAYRTLPAGFTQTGSLIDGVVVAETTKVWPSGNIVANRWNWDLPDAGFFYPGDVIHYFIKGQDNVSGDIGTSLLPGDTTGFSLFPGMDGYQPMRFPATWIVRALPTMNSATEGDQPKILWWNDFDTRGGENEWLSALYMNGYQEGVDFDAYYTNGPSSGVGNGLGGRASALQLAGYRTLLYTAGDLGSYTISNGDFVGDAGNDVAVLDAWLQQGGKNFFITGDDVEWDLNRSGTATVAFRNTWLSVSQTSGDLRPLINNQTAPKVLPIAGNPVSLDQTFIAYGGCAVFNDFDAVTTVGTAQRILEFANPAGAGGAYTYAAGVYNNVAAYTADVIYFPYDFMFIYDAAGQPALGKPVRAKVLEEILLFFGETGNSPIVDVPNAVFAAKNYPNPFNPSTKIEYSLPRAGELTIRIFNVRGELVRTLVDGNVDQPTGHVVWDGTDGSGKSVASGVYFYQVKTAGHEAFNKMTLVK